MGLIGLSEVCPIRMMPGMSQIFYIPKSYVNHSTSYIVKDGDGMMIGQINPNPSRSILTMPAMLDSKSYSVDTEDSENGTVYNHKIKGYYPAWNAAVIGEMNRMSKNLKFLAWIKHNGRNLNIMIGDLSAGASFAFNYNSGNKPGDREGTDFEWSWTTGQRITFQIPV